MFTKFRNDILKIVETRIGSCMDLMANAGWQSSYSWPRSIQALITIFFKRLSATQCFFLNKNIFGRFSTNLQEIKCF